jgi:hypothetical protein
VGGHVVVRVGPFVYFSGGVHEEEAAAEDFNVAREGLDDRGGVF